MKNNSEIILENLKQRCEQELQYWINQRKITCNDFKNGEFDALDAYRLEFQTSLRINNIKWMLAFIKETK